MSNKNLSVMLFYLKLPKANDSPPNILIQWKRLERISIIISFYSAHNSEIEFAFQFVPAGWRKWMSIAESSQFANWINPTIQKSNEKG